MFAWVFSTLSEMIIMIHVTSVKFKMLQAGVKSSSHDVEPLLDLGP